MTYVPRLLTALALLAWTAAASTSAASPAPSAKPFTFPRATPESQGVSSADLLAFVEALDRTPGLHSVMLVRHGAVVAEGWWAPYDPAHNHELYSLSKSFTSTAVGLAIADGKLTLDDEVLKFFPGDAPAEPSSQLKAMRVRDLLTMSTGHQDEPPTAVDKMSPRTFLAQAVPHKPGTHFKYNTAATFMLAAIVEKQTGQPLAEYLRPRLFEPLGITQPVWNTNFQGIALGGYGLSVRTEDIARFGQLYLQKGRWKRRQLLPAEWVDLATSRQVSNGSNPQSDWDQGYGFQFWRCRHQAYRGDGAFGQYCIILPGLDTVVAITAGVKDMQAVLNIVWDKLRPALKPSRLQSDPAARRQLAARLASLQIPTVTGLGTSPQSERVEGRTYVFPTNGLNLASFSLERRAQRSGWIATVVANGRTSRIPLGFGEWVSGRGSIGALRDGPLAGCAAWTGTEHCVVKLCAVETPFEFTWKLRFTGNELSLEQEVNVGFGPTRGPAIAGRVQP